MHSNTLEWGQEKVFLPNYSGFVSESLPFIHPHKRGKSVVWNLLCDFFYNTEVEGPSTVGRGPLLIANRLWEVWETKVCFFRF